MVTALVNSDKFATVAGLVCLACSSILEAIRTQA
jgi:hypothetical protein